MAAAIVLGFDPYLGVSGLTVPWRAVGIAASIVVALAVAAFLARRSPLLLPDDLLYIAIGAVPGAVVGGRVVHALAYLDFYRADPSALFDPARGSLSLLGAVVGGTLTGAAVLRLFGAPVRHWLDVVAIPLLVLICGGKLSQLLAGGGQGVPFDGPWAVAFAGQGPWLSLAPQMPAHPSQLYEAAWALLGIPLVALVDWRGAPLAGYMFATAIGWWLVGRFFVGFTWRDDRGLGPLNPEQALALVALGIVLYIVAVDAVRTSAWSSSSSS